MNVALTKHQKEFVEAKVRSGRYQDTSEVIREALRLLESYEMDRDWLEREIEEGISSGPGIVVTEEYFKEWRERLHRERDKRRQKSRKAA